MKSKNLPQKIFTKIKSWEGFEDFDGTDPEYRGKYHDPDVEFRKGYQPTVLKEAVRRKDIDVVKSLIQAGANVNDDKGMRSSPLYLCFDGLQANAEIAKELIKAGANVNYVKRDEICDDDEYSSTPLMRACLCGSYDFVKILLKAGADVNLVVGNDRSAIGMLDARSEGYIDILEMLISAGADVNTDGGQALQNAFLNSNFDAIKMLMKAGARTDIPSHDIPYSKGKTAFMSFLDGEGSDLSRDEVEEIFLLFSKHIGNAYVQDNNGKSLMSYLFTTSIGIADFSLLALDRILFNENFDVNLTDKNQNTALITLLLEVEEAESCSLNDVKYQIESLLIAGSNVECRNADGDSPKIIAKRIGNEEIQSLIENGVDLVNTEDRKVIAKRISYEDMEFLCSHSYTWGFLTKRISYEEIQSLIENSINTENKCGPYKGEMPLFTASKQGQTKKVKWLIKKGAYVNTKKSHILLDRYGNEKTVNPKLKTALMVAWNVEIARELIRAGADINVQDSDGNTALMVLQDIETAKELIRAGADMNVQNSDGNTALMLYAKDGWLEGVEELISAGADANLTNKWFETALTIAKRVGVYDAIITLLQKNTVKKVVPSILSTLFSSFR